MRKAKEKGTKQGERREDDEGRNAKGNEGATRWKTKMKEDGSVASYCTEIYFFYLVRWNVAKEEEGEGGDSISKTAIILPNHFCSNAAVAGVTNCIEIVYLLIIIFGYTPKLIKKIPLEHFFLSQAWKKLMYGIR